VFDSRELRHRIVIERLVSRQDPDTGELVAGWSVVWSDVPAQISPLSVREFIASQAVQSGVTARITIRYRQGLTADMRIVHNGKIYNPQGWFADLDSGLSYLTAPCTEGVNRG
jgi:SPP1 family predicted phage head-tail adaptor